MDLIYRPAPNGNGSTYYYMRDDMLESAAYKAKVCGNSHNWKVACNRPIKLSLHFIHVVYPVCNIQGNNKRFGQGQ